MKTGGAGSSAFLGGLLDYRNTPSDGGRSPVKMVFGITLWSRVPTLPIAHLTPAVTVQEHLDKTANLAAKTKARWDQTARVLPPLAVGMQVLVQNDVDKKWKRTGVITKAGIIRDYWVRMDGGSCVLRNRKFLRPLAPEFQPTASGPAASPAKVPAGRDAPPCRSSRVTFRNKRRPNRVRFFPCSMCSYPFLCVQPCRPTDRVRVRVTGREKCRAACVFPGFAKTWGKKFAKLSNFAKFQIVPFCVFSLCFFLHAFLCVAATLVLATAGGDERVS